jgi:competence protein ComGC
MKPHSLKRKLQAMTMVELLVVIAVLVVLIVLLLPVLAAAKRRSAKISCRSQLRQVTLSLKIWAEDHNNQYPMAVSVTNGGGKELIEAGDVAGFFQVASNELSTPKILVCPEDANVVYGPYNFGPGFGNTNISYFVGVDADESYPQRIMSGDDNLVVDGFPIKAGLLSLPTNASVTWALDRHDAPSRIPWLGIPIQHHFYGWLGFADGGVGMFFTPELKQVLVDTGLATNRLAIP